MVDPNIWGKHGWKFLHYVAQGYPDFPTTEDKITYKSFFGNIGNILPCYKCQQHYKQHLINMPLTDNVMSSKNNLETWVISVHNQVNISNQKSSLPINIAKQHIIIDDCPNTHFQENNISKQNSKKTIEIIKSNDDNNFNNIYIVTICILVAIIIFMFFKK